MLYSILGSEELAEERVEKVGVAVVVDGEIVDFRSFAVERRIGP